MPRRPNRRSLAASLRRRAAGGREREPDQTNLSVCPHCGRDYVVPVDWEEQPGERWWMFLRCAQCGMSREVTVSHAAAQRFDDELGRGHTLIARAARRLELERMAEDVERFVIALRRGFIEAGDFAT